MWRRSTSGRDFLHLIGHPVAGLQPSQLHPQSQPVFAREEPDHTLIHVLIIVLALLVPAGILGYAFMTSFVSGYSAQVSSEANSLVLAGTITVASPNGTGFMVVP
jgi:hypothetical protein